MRKSVVFVLLFTLASLVSTAQADHRLCRTEGSGALCHKVGEDDTVDTIAAKYGVPAKDIRERNSIGRVIILGDYLLIANKDERGEIEARIKKETTVEYPTDKITTALYVVRPGDTLYNVALRSGVPIKDIKENNSDVGSDNKIKVGQTLIIRPIVTAKRSTPTKTTRVAGKKSVKVEPRIEAWASKNGIDLLPDKCAPYEERMKEEADRYGFDWRVLAGLAGHESSCNPDAEGKLGERSMYQFLPETARMVIEEYGLKGINISNPDDATKLAALHFADLLEEFGGDYQRAIAAWNMGEREARKLRKPSDWLYVKRVTYIYGLFV